MEENEREKTQSDWGRLVGGSLSKTEFWQRVAGITFGLWSLSIPLGVWVITSTFDRSSLSANVAAAEFVAFSRRFDNYVLAMERRITIVEERQATVLKTLNEIDTRIENSESHVRGTFKKAP